MEADEEAEERADAPSSAELAGLSEGTSSAARPEDEPSGKTLGGPPERSRYELRPEELGARALGEATQSDPSELSEEEDELPAEEAAIVPEPEPVIFPEPEFPEEDDGRGDEAEEE